MEGSDKIPQRSDENKDDYIEWKKYLDLWCDFTSIKKEKQAKAVHLQLTGRAQKASSKVSIADMKRADSMKTILEAMDRVFGQDKNLKFCNAYFTFENFVSDKSCSTCVCIDWKNARLNFIDTGKMIS